MPPTVRRARPPAAAAVWLSATASFRIGGALTLFATGARGGAGAEALAGARPRRRRCPVLGRVRDGRGLGGARGHAALRRVLDRRGRRGRYRSEPKPLAQRSKPAAPGSQHRRHADASAARPRSPAAARKEAARGAPSSDAPR